MSATQRDLHDLRSKIWANGLVLGGCVLALLLGAGSAMNAISHDSARKFCPSNTFIFTGVSPPVAVGLINIVSLLALAVLGGCAAVAALAGTPMRQLLGGGLASFVGSHRRAFGAAVVFAAAVFGATLPALLWNAACVSPDGLLVRRSLWNSSAAG